MILSWLLADLKDMRFNFMCHTHELLLVNCGCRSSNLQFTWINTYFSTAHTLVFFSQFSVFQNLSIAFNAFIKDNIRRVNVKEI
jgi:hypothetical protein